MPLTDIVAKMNLANKENKAEARDDQTPDKEIADASLKPGKEAAVVARSKAMDEEEPLLRENPRRFVILPIQ